MSQNWVGGAFNSQYLLSLARFLKWYSSDAIMHAEPVPAELHFECWMSVCYQRTFWARPCQRISVHLLNSSGTKSSKIYWCCRSSSISEAANSGIPHLVPRLMSRFICAYAFCIRYKSCTVLTSLEQRRIGFKDRFNQALAETSLVKSGWDCSRVPQMIAMARPMLSVLVSHPINFIHVLKAFSKMRGLSSSPAHYIFTPSS